MLAPTPGLPFFLVVGRVAQTIFRVSTVPRIHPTFIDKHETNLEGKMDLEPEHGKYFLNISKSTTILAKDFI